MGGDGYTKVVGHGRGGGIWHNDWRCDKCSEAGEPHWVHAKHWHCQVCGKLVPADPTRYWQSKQYKALQSVGKGKGVYGVEGEWDADAEGGDTLAWAEEQWKSDGTEEASAVFVQDDM